MWIPHTHYLPPHSQRTRVVSTVATMKNADWNMGIQASFKILISILCVGITRSIVASGKFLFLTLWEAHAVVLLQCLEIALVDKEDIWEVIRGAFWICTHNRSGNENFVCGNLPGEFIERGGWM